MKILQSIALGPIAGLFITSAEAQTAPVPPCWPKQIGGTGTAAKVVRNTDGEAAAWTCTVKTVVKPYAAFRLYSYTLVDPDTTGMTAIGTAKAYWLANATMTCDTNEKTKTLCALAFKAL